MIRSFLKACVGVWIVFTTLVRGGAVKVGQPVKFKVSGGFCVRLFHTQGDIGCRTTERDVSAPLHEVSDARALNEYIALRKESILVMSSHLFTSENLAKLQMESMNNAVKGIILYPDAKEVPSSPDSKTPQGKETTDAQVNPFAGFGTEWNANGQNVLGMSLRFPVIIMKSSKDVAEILQKAEVNKNNHAISATYTGYMSYYFGPDVMNSVDCLTFQDIKGNDNPRCDPIGGQSSWGFMGDLANADSIVMAISAMDAKAISQEIAPGANSAVSGVVALLAAADALRTIPVSDLTKTIVFALFQGERFGFVGSRKFLEDIALGKGVCKNPSPPSAKTPFGNNFCLDPLKVSMAYSDIQLSKVDHVIAVDQVGTSAMNGNMFVHENPDQPSSGTISTLVSEKSGGKFRKASASSTGLPPGPLSSFVNGKEYGKFNLSAAVLTGYDARFVGASYHSRFDVAEAVDVNLIAQTAAALARTLYSLATDGKGVNENLISVNTSLVREMFQCMTTDWRCSLMDRYSKYTVDSITEHMGEMNPPWPEGNASTLYAGVFSGFRQPQVATDTGRFARLSNEAWRPDFQLNLWPNALEVFTKSFLGSVTGKVSENGDKDCMKTQECDEATEECVYPGKCKARSSFFHNAVSPGLKEDLTPNLFRVINRNMPIWTEPKYTGIETFVYADPGNTIGWVSIVLGVVITAVGGIASILFLRLFKKHKLL